MYPFELVGGRWRPCDDAIAEVDVSVSNIIMMNLGFGDGRTGKLVEAAASFSLRHY